MIRDNRAATRKDKSVLIGEIGSIVKIVKNEEIRDMLTFLKDKLGASRGTVKDVAEYDMEIHELLQKINGYQQQGLVETCRFAADRIEMLIDKRDEASYELQGQSGGFFKKLFRANDDKNEKETKDKLKQYFDYQLQLTAQREKRLQYAQQHDDARSEAVELLRVEKLTSAQLQKKNLLLQTVKNLQNKMAAADQLITRIATQIEQHEKLMTAEELREGLEMIASNPLVDINKAEEVVAQLDDLTDQVEINTMGVNDVLGELNFNSPAQSQQETDLERELMMEANIANAQAEIEREDAAQKAAEEEAAKAEYDRMIAQEVARRLAQAQAEAAENAQRAQDEASAQQGNETRNLQEE